MERKKGANEYKNYIVDFFKNPLRKVSLIDLLLYIPFILFLSGIVMTREYNFLFLIPSFLAFVYKMNKGYLPTIRDLATLISIVGGAYIAYRAHSIGSLGLILGILTGFILITTYDLINEENGGEE